MKVTMTVGISASGKSTWVRQQELNPGVVVTELDRIRHFVQRYNRPELDTSDGVVWSEWNWGDEKLVLMLQAFQIHLAKEQGWCEEIIFADTNLTKATRERIVRQFTKWAGMDPDSVELKIFDTPLEVCLERDAKRVHPVGADVIRSQHERKDITNNN